MMGTREIEEGIKHVLLCLKVNTNQDENFNKCHVRKNQERKAIN